MDNKNIVLLCPELLAIFTLEELELTRVEHNILAEVYKDNHSGDQEEPIARTALELKKSSSKTVHFSEWSDVNGLLRSQGKIYILQTLDLCRKIVALCYDTKIARHPRR